MTPEQLVFGQQPLTQNLFPDNSRYHGSELGRMEDVNGKEIVYLLRRFVPPADQLTVMQEHAVVQGDRLDDLASRYLGDAEQFWRICDGNNAMQPDALMEPIGRRLRMTMPEGMPGGPRV
jgi:hypothetical protein